MSALLLSFPGNEALADTLAERLRWEVERIETRAFPDGETYVRIAAPCAGRSVALVCTLDRPDRKALPLLIGPDVESEQWVAEVARLAAAPHVVASKLRRGAIASLAG